MGNCLNKIVCLRRFRMRGERTPRAGIRINGINILPSVAPRSDVGDDRPCNYGGRSKVDVGRGIFMASGAGDADDASVQLDTAELIMGNATEVGARDGATPLPQELASATPQPEKGAYQPVTIKGESEVATPVQRPGKTKKRINLTRFSKLAQKYKGKNAGESKMTGLPPWNTCIDPEYLSEKPISRKEGLHQACTRTVADRVSLIRLVEDFPNSSTNTDQQTEYSLSTVHPSK